MIPSSAPDSTAPRLILASSSAYRRELLARLRLPFEAISPDIDESPQPGESPDATALRLAVNKAAAIAAMHPDAWPRSPRLCSPPGAERWRRALRPAAGFRRYPARSPRMAGASGPATRAGRPSWMPGSGAAPCCRGRNLVSWRPVQYSYVKQGDSVFPAGPKKLHGFFD